jgi:hypothetical protein
MLNARNKQMIKGNNLSHSDCPSNDTVDSNRSAFYPEDGDSMFLRIIVSHISDYNIVS